MDINKQHPLQQIAGYNSLSMLENLIPFVDYSLKLPLALFIKFNEIKLIINTFQTPDLLLQYGLHNTSSSPMDLLCSLTGVPPELLQMLFTMQNDNTNPMSNDFLSQLTGFMGPNKSPDFSSFSNMFDNMPPPENNSFDTNDFASNIDDIFSKYDASLHTDSTNTE